MSYLAIKLQRRHDSERKIREIYFSVKYEYFELSGQLHGNLNNNNYSHKQKLMPNMITSTRKHSLL